MKDTGKSNGAFSDAQKEFLTMTIDGQMFGIHVMQVQDVLGLQRVTRVPLAPPEVEGSLNLRGRIVTAINMRTRLGIALQPENSKSMSIVVDHRGDLFSLTVDGVGEVLSLPDSQFEKVPATLDKVWRQHASGIYRLDGELLVILDVTGMLDDLCNHEADAA